MTVSLTCAQLRVTTAGAVVNDARLLQLLDELGVVVISVHEQPFYDRALIDSKVAINIDSGRTCIHWKFDRTSALGRKRSRVIGQPKARLIT